jgi:hypothetical protein
MKDHAAKVGVWNEDLLEYCLLMVLELVSCGSVGMAFGKRTQLSHSKTRCSYSLPQWTVYSILLSLWSTLKLQC